MNTWAAVILAGIGTYALRASMLAGFAGGSITGRPAVALGRVAPAVVAVMVAASLRPAHGAGVPVGHLFAALVAFVVVRRTRAVVHGALAGMACIWLAGLIELF